MTSFLDRYLQGEYEQVWDELYALGEEIQQEPLLNDANAVTIETMRRVRMNTERVTARLSAIGYTFGIYPDGRTRIYGYTQPYRLPKASIASEITEFEQLAGVGRLPLSLKFFWQIVGNIDWMGYHPLWPKYSDPLVVYPIETARIEYEDWCYDVDKEDVEAGSFRIPIAPDYYHKDNVSGGTPYSIFVPNAKIDAVLEYERHQTTFVNYLRNCFLLGGFPGIKWHNGEVPRIMARLSEELLSF